MKIPINIKTGEVKSDKVTDTIVGIDLGTTNSLVAYIKNDHPIAVKGKNQKNTLVPSIVHFDNDGQISVGITAKDRLIESPERTIFSVKRLMGKSYSDLSGLKSLLGYTIIDEDEEKLVKIKVDDAFYSPIELSSYILKELKERVEEELNQPIQKAVITVPAYFNDAQRQATRDAGKLAGLDVLRIVNEPTAASLAYGIGLHKDENKKIVVYDLGGGTFDVTILEIEDGVFDVLSTNGNTFLGGDDFDRAIVDHWVNTHVNIKPLVEEKSGLQALRLMAEEAKKALSNQSSFTGKINGIELPLKRTIFEELIHPLVENTLSACKAALRDAGLDTSDIDEIVFVGGSTRVPLVKNTISNFFQKPVNDTINPDEVVALGAAIQADILAGNRKDLLLLDVTPLSLGIETVGGLMDVIIPRNSKVPASQGRNYTTSVDGQKNLKVAVYQGERDLVEHNRKLGEFILRDIPPMPAGIPKLLIQFILDADGILTVKAMEERSETTTAVEIRSQYGISEEDMARMLLDSIKNAQSDMHAKALIESQTEADNIILSTEKFLVQNKDLLVADEKEKLNAYLTQLKEARKNGGKDELATIMHDLNQYARPLAQKALDKNISSSISGQKI